MDDGRFLLSIYPHSTIVLSLSREDRLYYYFYLSTHHLAKNIGNGGIGDGFLPLSRTPPAWQSRPFPAPSRIPAEDY